MATALPHGEQVCKQQRWSRATHEHPCALSCGTTVSPAKRPGPPPRAERPPRSQRPQRQAQGRRGRPGSAVLHVPAPRARSGAPCPSVLHPESGVRTGARSGPSPVDGGRLCLPCRPSWDSEHRPAGGDGDGDGDRDGGPGARSTTTDPRGLPQRLGPQGLLAWVSCSVSGPWPLSRADVGSDRRARA